MDTSDFPVFDEYVDSFVAFVDVLGFTDKVRTIEHAHDFADAARILYVLKKEAESYSNAGSHLKDLRMTAVSDSVIVTIPYRAQYAASLFLPILHKLQYELLALPLKTLVRGYVARGPVYHRNGVLFGKGYLDAYYGEAQAKGPPRIVLAPEIATATLKAAEAARPGETAALSAGLLRRDDADGFYFLDYLAYVGVPGSHLSREKWRAENRDIKVFVASCLARFSDNDSIVRKFRWLETYLASIPDP